MIKRLIFLSLIPVLSYSQLGGGLGIGGDNVNSDDCQDIYINSTEYEIFDDQYDVFESQQVVLVPVFINNDNDLMLESYQFNLMYDPTIMEPASGYIDDTNSSLFFNLYDITPAASNVSNGGSFSINTFSIESTNFSMLSIAYGASNAQELDNVMLYIPFFYYSDGCLDVDFVDGFFNNSYVNPNQTYAMLLNGIYDYSNCVESSSICVGCFDSNSNFICDELEAGGCTDILACNYDATISIDDGSCEFVDDLCDICEDGVVFENDTDNDGICNDEDDFPDDPNETTDTDGDGVGDNGDDFPDDPNETTDTDGDGVGDNGDDFPDDPNETTDTDGDGVGDNGDDFPDDPNETTDTDGDGVGDNGDDFPDDPNRLQIRMEMV